MTVQTETSRSGPYAGSGTTGPFTVGFRFLSSAHLQVIKTSTAGIDTTLTLTTHYTVSGTGGATGTVTLVTALATGEKLTIIRDVPYTQLADYVNNDAFPAESHEDALDLLTMQTQQNREVLDRSLTLPATVSGVSAELPTPSGLKVIGWNAAGTALENLDGNTLASVVAYGTASSDLFDGNGSTTAFTLTGNPASINNLDVSIGGVAQRPVLDYTWTSGTTITFTSAPPIGTQNILVRYMQALAMGSGAASDIQYLPSGTGAVATDVQSKLREFVSVKDFGAVGDGSTSDTAAIQAMFDAVATSGAKEIYFPPGTYLLPCNRTDADYTCAVVIRGLQNVVVRGAKGAKFTQNTSGTGPSEYGMFRVEECVGVTFTGFEMDGIGIVTTGTGANRSRGFLLATIDVNNKAIDLAPNQRLEFCNIHAHDIGGFIGYALRDETVYNGPPRGLGLYVHDCLVERLGNDHGVGIGYMSDVVIENNRFINSLPAGVVPENMAVDLSAGIYDGIVRNNYVYGFIFGMKAETHTNKFPGGTDQRTSKRVLFENNYLEQIGSPTACVVGTAPDAGGTYGIKLNSQGAAAVNNTIIARSISVTTGGLNIGVAALDTSALESHVLVDSNYIVGAYYGVLHTNTATNHAFTTVIRDNRINDAILHGVNVGQDCTVEGNRIYRSGSEAVTAQTPIAQTYIRNNFALDCATTNNPTIAATVVISQSGTGAQGYFEVTGNVIEDTRGAGAADYGYFFHAYGAPTTNKIVFTPGYSAGLLTAITFDKYFSAINQTNQLDATLVPGPRTIIASNIPSATGPWLSMPWNVGDRAIFSVPAVGLPKAWVCTVAGTPGTWVSEGNL